MSLRSPVFAPRLLRGWTGIAIVALLAACGTSAPASSSGATAETEPTAAASSAAEPTAAESPTVAPSEAAVAEICLPADVLAAIEEIADGNLEPEVALGEIADAVEALDVSELEGEVPFAEQDRDDLVKNLREAEPNPTQLEFAADVFRSELFELVGPCDAGGSAGSATDCLSADVVAALDELDSGNLGTDPAPAEVADALAALELDGAAAEARDNTVATLRESPLNEAGVVQSLQMLYSQVALPEC